ncbi:hypothetical protein ADK66_00390 [Micromonospora sp. NRRL B-16802]|nr:hypothetical protein ADK66_00390 [Micromonospora sp. NRRL B-16802]
MTDERPLADALLELCDTKDLLGRYVGAEIAQRCRDLDLHHQVGMRKDEVTHSAIRGLKHLVPPSLPFGVASLWIPFG